MSDDKIDDGKNNKKILSLDDPDLPDWEERQNQIFNLLESIDDPEERDKVANQISTLKFMYEIQLIDEVDDTIKNFFENSLYDFNESETQESTDNNDFILNIDNENDNSLVIPESTFNFNLPDIMDSLRTRLGYDENNENSMIFNETTNNFHMFNEFTLNSLEMPSNSDNKYRYNSPEEYNFKSQKPTKKVKFLDEETTTNSFHYTIDNGTEYDREKDIFLQNSPPTTNNKTNYNEPYRNLLFATQNQFINNQPSSYNDCDNNLKSPKENFVDQCTLFQTQNAFVTNFNKPNTESVNINFFDTQMPIDNSKFITASQFPATNKDDRSFKIPLLPGFGIGKKPIIPKQTFALRKSFTVFDSVIERTDEGINFIKREIKKAEEDDCNLFGSDSNNEKKSSPMEYDKMSDTIDLQEVVEKKEQELEGNDIKENVNDIYIRRSSLVDVGKNEYCYNTNDTDTINNLTSEKISLRYATTSFIFSKSNTPLNEKLYLKVNEDMFSSTFSESQYIDRISKQTTRLSLTIAEMASLKIDNSKDLFNDFCSLIKKARSTVKIIKTFREQNHFDLNKFDRYGMTPLHYAVLTNKVSIVKWLIEECNHCINPHGGFDAKTPLHLAVTYKKTSIIKELCNKIGVEVDAKDIYGVTPMNACNYDEKIKSMLTNSKRKSFIKNNYFKLMPKIVIDPSLDVESIKKWKKIPYRKSYEVFTLSKMTTHWITKSLALDMIKESDALYEAIIRRIYILHENSLKIILENNSIDQFNIEENRYIYFKGVLLNNGKYENSNLKEGPKTKLAMKPNLFRGCYFYIDIFGVEGDLQDKLKKWIILGEGELLKNKRSIDDVLENRRDVVPFYITIDDRNIYDNKLSSSSTIINTFIITDKTPESWMVAMSRKNALIKTSEFIKRSIRSFTIDYNY